MAAEYITVCREGHTYRVTRDLTEEERKYNWYRRSAKTITETLRQVQAKIISPKLALFQYEKASTYLDSRYHVIHIPTGLVIADITYDLVKDVKKTFEAGNWTLKGDNTLVLVYDTIQFEMTCKIRYDIIEKDVV